MSVEFLSALCPWIFVRDLSAKILSADSPRTIFFFTSCPRTVRGHNNYCIPVRGRSTDKIIFSLLSADGPGTEKYIYLCPRTVHGQHDSLSICPRTVRGQ